MNTFYKTARALQVGLGLALVAAFALVNGCASQDPVGESVQLGEESIGESEQAILASGTYACTNGGTMIDGALMVKPDGTCCRANAALPGASHGYCFGGTCPSCWSLASTPPACLMIPGFPC
jgi:hypothetical protein